MRLPIAIRRAPSEPPRAQLRAGELDQLGALGGRFHPVAVDADHRRPGDGRDEQRRGERGERKRLRIGFSSVRSLNTGAGERCGPQPA